ncbi:MAG: terminase small subunit [Salinisphaera sp.]|nr:terminase small subunit [Salinisphaera sp.]
MKTLQPKHQLVADVWLGTDGDVLASYRAAGFRGAEKTARAVTSRILARPEVRAYIEKRQEVAGEKASIDVAQVLTELGRVGFFNPAKVRRAGGFLPIEEWDEDSLAAVAGIEYVQSGDECKTVKVKLAAKTTALAKIGEHLNMFVQQHKVDLGTDLVNSLLEQIDGAGTGLPPRRTDASDRH